MKSHWDLFAGYNAWANARLYAAVAAAPEGSFHRDGGAFFGSLCGTLNHLLVTDRIWMKRFTGEGEAPDRLDAVLFENLGALAHARAAEDRRIIAWVQGLGERDLAAPVRYRRTSSPEVVTQPLGAALAHMFNHHAHHRGQAHALLTRFAGQGAAPVLDLLAYQRESGAAG